MIIISFTYNLGQFSREYIYGEEHRPILQFNKHSLIPEILLTQVRQAKNSEFQDGNCFMGLFPEIRRAWLTVGNSLYLWSFENNRDFTHYCKIQHEIIDVALVRPKSGVFNDSIEWLIVVVTPVDISLLAAVFKSPDQTGHSGSSCNFENIKSCRNFSALDLVLHETGLVFPSDEVNMVSICGTQEGRIFLAGSDGNIYELIYQAESDWFASKCKKINRTASSLSYIIPTFLRSSPSRPCIVKLILDPSRNLIYGLTEQSTIHVYWLGYKNQDFEFIGVTGDLSIEAMKLTPAGIISSSKALDIVSLHPVDSTESEIIGLVAICRSGIRLYFSIVGSGLNYPQSNLHGSPHQAPRGIRLAHLRAPPEENRTRDPKKLVHRWSPNIHCAFYSSGVTLAANSVSSEEDALLGMILNPSVGSLTSNYRLPLEYSIETEIDGKVWAIEELTSESKDSSDPSIKGLGKEFALAHLSPRRFFSVLTNVGVYVYSKLRPVDQLYLLLSESNIEWNQLERFFDSYGPDQACSFCISLCCRSATETRMNSALTGSVSESSITFNSNVISALLKLGGQPRLLEALQHQNSNFSHNNQSNNFRDGIGRIIATQPEFENSAMHEGFYIFFSRLVSSIWKKNLWEFSSVPGHLIIDLSRFHKFILDNLNIFTEKRQNLGVQGVSEDIVQRHQSAIESENESLFRLKEIIGLLIELLTFISICLDYKLLDSVRTDQIGIEHSAMDIEMILTNSKGKTLITELGNILVQKQLKLRTPIRPLCDSLRSRCSSFFSEEDVFLQEGIESLERARLCISPTERAENVSDGLQSLKKACKVIPFSNLHTIFSQLDSLGFPDSSLQLGLRFIEVIDPDNLCLQRELHPNIQLNADELEICRQREKIYERLMESLSCTGFDSEKTALIHKLNPNVEIKTLRDNCLRLAASSRDEVFHYRLYEWLVKSKFTQTLLELPQTEYLCRFLRSTFVSRESSHIDLLWKWLARSRKYSEAASVLASIAESCDYRLTLAERIEYISLAITHSKSATLDNPSEATYNQEFDEIAPVALNDLEELLEVAHTQYEVLKEAKSVLGGLNENVCSELDGLVGLLNVSDLFNRYAKPYGLTESCLRLIHVSGLVNENLVAQLWQDIISRYIKPNSDRSSFHQLGSKITELTRKFYPSPYAFPLAHLIDVLGRLAMSCDIGADWLVAVLINAGIPFSALADELHRFFSSPPSNAWLNSSFRNYLLEMIVILYSIGSKDYSRISPNNPSIVTRLRLYATAADDLHSGHLVTEFGSLLKQLASF
jgi:nuclear pore complex protein Nup155